MSTDFTGQWSANLVKSRLTGQKPQAIRATIEHREGRLRLQLIVTNAAGKEERMAFACRIDDTESAEINGSPVRAKAGWDNEELVIESWPQFGSRTMHFLDCWRLSVDGQNLTMEHRGGDLLGQLTVFERVP